MTESTAERLTAAGWNAMAPSEDCLRACERPLMPEHLPELDRLGIHGHLLLVDLIRRFPCVQGEDKQEREQILRGVSLGRTPAPIRLGRSTRWNLDECRRWLAAGAPSRERWEAMRERRP